jgi:hypothetical protein
MKKRILLSLIATTSLMMAEEVKKEETKAFTAEVSIYTGTNNNSGETKDSGFSVGSVYLNYTTPLNDSFKASVGARANVKLNEKEKSDYWGKNDDDTEAKHINAVVTEANLAYSKDGITVIAGRQPIDLEWIGDYHNAIVGIAELNKLTFVAGFTNAKGVADSDAALEKVTKLNDGKTKATVFDVTYSLNDDTKIGGYFMNATELFSAVGAKAEVKIADITTTLKYASTNEKAADTKDGTILALDFGYETDAIKLQAGYIKAGKENGIGSLGTLGDNINPLDSGNKVYEKDAKSVYFGAGTNIADFELGVIYGTTNYKEDDGSKSKEKEFNFTIDKEIMQSLALGFIYSKVDAQAINDDTSSVALQLTYSF